nr:MAG TPA: hypothetical protein [Caudoviricetes sp.]
MLFFRSGNSANSNGSPVTFEMVEFFFEKIYNRSTTQRRIAAKPLP